MILSTLLSSFKPLTEILFSFLSSPNLAGYEFSSLDLNMDGTFVNDLNYLTFCFDFENPFVMLRVL